MFRIKIKFSLLKLNRKLDDDDKKEEAPEKESEKASEVDSDRKLTDEGNFLFLTINVFRVISK